MLDYLCCKFIQMTELTDKTLKWEIKKFHDLSPLELHDLLKVRVDVFVVEQECAYEEIDGKDPACWHLIGKDSEGTVQATTRIAPQAVIYPELSIGRVAVSLPFRGLKLGKKMMELSIDFAEQELNVDSIKIAAQLYLKKFYSDLGFEQISDVYPWDGIDHIDMRKTRV